MTESNNIFMGSLPTMVALTSFITPALDSGDDIIGLVTEMLVDSDDLTPLIIGQSIWIHVLIEALVAAGGLSSVEEYLHRLGLSAVPGMGTGDV